MANPGVTLPGFLHEGKVRANAAGAKKVASMVGGVALGMGILAGGVWLFNTIRGAAGVDETTGASISIN